MRYMEEVPYETILRALELDEDAMEEVVQRFQGKIRDSARTWRRNADGSRMYYVDPDIMLQLQTKLLLGIMKFRILPEQKK